MEINGTAIGECELLEALRAIEASHERACQLAGNDGKMLTIRIIPIREEAICRDKIEI